MSFFAVPSRAEASSDLIAESHRHDVLARGLLRIGLFKAGPLGSASEDEVVAKLISEGLTSAFYPHGVGASFFLCCFLFFLLATFVELTYPRARTTTISGHLLGLDVHDVGGLPEGRSSEPLLKYLRLRVPLEEGFVVTVEPGCYFNEHLFAPHVNSEFVDHALLAKYKYVGGVRIEDK